MKTRIISGIVLFVLLLFMLTSGGTLLAVCLCFLSLVASRELSTAFGLSGAKEMPKGAELGAPHGKTGAMEIAGFVGVLVHYAVLIITNGEARFFIGTVIAYILTQTLIYVIRFPAFHISQLTDTVFCFLYAPVMLSFLFLIRELEYGYLLVWLPFLAWVCDTFAYFAGMACGKHKLCPLLSPKKTVEGSVGGVIGTMAASTLFGIALPQMSGYYNERVIWACLLIGLAVGVLSQLGDLLASGIKRDRGIKDYGTLIPGHGGIMDRFDSVLFVSPVVYFLIVFLLLPKGV